MRNKRAGSFVLLLLLLLFLTPQVLSEHEPIWIEFDDITTPADDTAPEDVQAFAAPELPADMEIPEPVLEEMTPEPVPLVTSEPTVEPVAILDGLHPEDHIQNPTICLICGQPYTQMDWENHRVSGQYVSLHGTRFEVSGIIFSFYSASPEVPLLIDVNRMMALIEAIDVSIPVEYRRKYVDEIIILVSNESYCLRYESWTDDMQYGLVEDLSSYFTSEKALQDVGGCTASFPNTGERERVIWLPIGQSTQGDYTLREFANCAYSYHIYTTHEMNMLSKLTHEIIHALSLNRTMPSLTEYGFSPNHNWEIQQVDGAAGLSTAEAFAYDLSKQVMRSHKPGSIIISADEPQLAPMPDTPMDASAILQVRAEVRETEVPAPTPEPTPEITQEPTYVMWVMPKERPLSDGEDRTIWLKKDAQ